MKKVAVLKTEGFTARQAGEFQLGECGTLLIQGAQYEPPDRTRDGEAYRTWVELVKGLRDATELNHLARALVR